jgi:hypothetical protein
MGLGEAQKMATHSVEDEDLMKLISFSEPSPE